MGDQVVDGKVGDDNIQRELNKVRFQGIPIVIIDRSKPKKVENKIDQPEQEVIPDRNSKFGKKFFEHHAIL